VKILYRFSGCVLLEVHENTLRGAGLSGTDLRWANLRGADLWRADLRGANLTEADLSRANLQGADLRGANLHRAVLYDARLFATIGVLDAGQGPHGWRFVGVQHDNGWIIYAGYYSLTIPESEAHYVDNPDALERIARIKAAIEGDYVL